MASRGILNPFSSGVVLRPLVRPSVPLLRTPQPGRWGSKKKGAAGGGDESKADAKQVQQQRERASLREQTKKAEQRRVAKLKDEARLAAKSPLCMDVETALRYLRAAEVGRPAEATTISLHMAMIAEKGAAMVQGSYRLPRALEEQRIAVFTNDADAAAAARRAGAALVGSDDLIQQVRDGVINFDRAYATPDMMGRLNTVARTLGPRGLMPSAKRGTVTSAANMYNVINEAAGETIYKQKTPVLSLPVGRCSFSDYEIVRNIVAVTDSIRDTIAKMDKKKAPSIGKTTISSSVGPNIIIQV
ncbi:hypothetical protein TRICI_001066 [Trichomonascus ciferrii]|uniref:Ribosomal protein n=1 Tax=Trichomonascus ciferrii TaxID=44093 RepID=A0A642VAA2_9ASCO|nr:hypothetical protein TRICI_001066 [Trichomonascus ciferrii]